MVCNFMSHNMLKGLKERKNIDQSKTIQVSGVVCCVLEIFTQIYLNTVAFKCIFTTSFCFKKNIDSRWRSFIYFQQGHLPNKLLLHKRLFSVGSDICCIKK